MIIYSEKPFNAQMLNLLLLEDTTTGGYIYINKEVFAQALSLSITYDNNHSRILERIVVSRIGNYFMNKPLMGVINHFQTNAPEPINMLASYLAYTAPANVEWSDDMGENMVKAYGYLHMFSNFVDFYRYTLAAKEVRTELNLANHVLNSYESSWEDLTGTLADKVVLEKEVHIKEIVTREVIDEVHTQVAAPSIVGMPLNNPTAPIIPPPVPVATPTEPVVQPTPVPTPTPEPVPVVAPPTPAPAPQPPKEDDNIVYVDASALDDFEAKMKELERKALEKAKAKNAEKKEAPAPKKEEPKKDAFGDSGMLQISEEEIAEESKKILDEFDI